jgi:CubicO group peptidase (beta-lactamase class C family)
MSLSRPAGSAIIAGVHPQADLVAAGGPQFEAALASHLTGNRLAGGVAGVVYGDELAWSAGAGFADQAARKASDPAMLYAIASITKTFTGTAIMQLRDAGRLDLDDPAVAWLPELRQAASPFGPIETVTLRRMLSHESGLPAEPPGTDWAIPAYQGDPEQTLRRAGEIAVTLAPNAEHKYSDLAYQLLGAVVTRASGIPYPNYVQEAILQPLGMTATGFAPLSAGMAARCATGYDWRALSDELNPAPAMPPVWAEGGLWSCVDDLASWLSFQMRAHRDPAAPSPVLSAASLRQMHRPRYLAGDGWTEAWGISWGATRQDDSVWINHSGGLPGYTTTVCFDPGTQVGAIVLLNGTTSSVAVAMDLAATARRLARSAPPPVHAPSPAPREYRPLLGIYARPGLGGWLLRLEWRDGKLTATFGEPVSWQLVLAPTSDPDTFTVESGTGLTGERVRFRRLAGGQVGSVVLMETTWERLEPAGADLRPVEN